MGDSDEDFHILASFWPADSPLTRQVLSEAQADGYQYCVAFIDDIPAAVGAIWRYSDDQWEVAAIATLPHYRRRGLATAVVCHLTRTILTCGKRPTLTTALDNVAMRAVAEQVGFELLLNC
jgi:predicted GNAT family acetyltransferase